MSLDLEVSLVSCTMATWMLLVVKKCISSEALLLIPLMLICTKVSVPGSESWVFGGWG